MRVQPNAFPFPRKESIPLRLKSNCEGGTPNHSASSSIPNVFNAQPIPLLVPCPPALLVNGSAFHTVVLPFVLVFFRNRAVVPGEHQVFLREDVAFVRVGRQQGRVVEVLTILLAASIKLPEFDRRQESDVEKCHQGVQGSEHHTR